MRKMGFTILQIHTVEEKASSPTGAILIGAIVLLVIIIVLYRRQKRKFND